MTYRTEASSALGRWGLTIVREGEEPTKPTEPCGCIHYGGSAVAQCQGPHTRGSGGLLRWENDPNGPPEAEPVAVVVNGDRALAERICALLTADSGTPDRTYLRGASDALAEVRRRLIVWSKLAEDGEKLSEALAHGILRAAAAELGVDEGAPETAPRSTETAQQGAAGGSGGAEVAQAISGRFWGEHPAHPTCIDVTNIRAGRMPGSEWRCGPECPRHGAVI